MTPIADSELIPLLSRLELFSIKEIEHFSEQAKITNVSLYNHLREKGSLSETQLGQLIATYYNLQFIEFPKQPIDEKVLQVLPHAFAVEHHVLPFAIEKNELQLAIAFPNDWIAVDEVQQAYGLPVKRVVAPPAQIANSLGMFQPKLSERIAVILGDSLNSSTIAEEELPTVEIVDEIFMAAVHSRTSDIHFDPENKTVDVRFRIDGVLHDQASLPKALYPGILARLKVLSELRTDEHTIPQDGRLQIPTSSEPIDTRISVVPTTRGEKVALRLLSSSSRSLVLAEVGLSESDIELITNAYNKPHGMILVTGPTGSGKTTTLYSLIKLLNQRDVNIMTVEDPVEYQIPGISQIHVNTLVGLTFAEGLRSIVRQDPDILLVGEIRDKESADIAVNAAMTGHLILSSLHTNNAATTFPRLTELGIEPFLTASSVTIIIAQRLVRLICSHCRYSLELTANEIVQRYHLSAVETEQLKALGSTFAFPKGKAKMRLYEGKGCSACSYTGFNGRIGIFEVLPVNDAIRDLIAKREDAIEIENVARRHGMKTMLEDGLAKVQMGVTTLSEVIRVTRLSE